MQALAIKHGVIQFAIMTVYTVLIWLSGNLLRLWWLSLIVGVVVAVLVLRAALKEAKTTLFDNVLKFNNGFKTALFVMVVATALSTIFSYFFFQFVYTDFKQDQIQYTVQMLESYKAPSEEIDKQIAKIEAQTIWHQLLNSLLGGLVGSAILSLIMASVMKTPEPKQE